MIIGECGGRVRALGFDDIPAYGIGNIFDIQITSEEDYSPSNTLT